MSNFTLRFTPRYPLHTLTHPAPRQPTPVTVYNGKTTAATPAARIQTAGGGGVVGGRQTEGRRWAKDGARVGRLGAMWPFGGRGERGRWGFKMGRGCVIEGCWRREFWLSSGRATAVEQFQNGGALKLQSRTR